MPAFIASAIGSGIGSLLQGGTTDDALQAGLLGGIGGAIGGQLGGAGGDAAKMTGMDSALMGGSNINSAMGQGLDGLSNLSTAPNLSSSMSAGTSIFYSQF